MQIGYNYLLRVKNCQSVNCYTTLTVCC